jgi:hypothetical protein
MVIQMLSRRGKLLSRLKTRPSFAGTGLLERMRSTTFALLGITAAMGLGLVAIVSQQGWPLLPASPLPAPPGEQGAIDDAAVVQMHRTPISPRRSTEAAGGRSAMDGRAVDRTEGRESASHLSGSRQLATAPLSPPADPAGGNPAGRGAPVEPPPVAQSPGGPAAPIAPPQPAAPPPSPVTAPSGPEPSPVTASPNRGKGGAYGKYKPSGGSKDKSHRYESPAPVAPAPTVVETDEYADGAEEHDEGEQEPSRGSPGGDGRGHGHGHDE